jgi:hypothetical protein
MTVSLRQTIKRTCKKPRKNASKPEGLWQTFSLGFECHLLHFIDETTPAPQLPHA